jgi:hypothetical protein
VSPTMEVFVGSAAAESTPSKINNVRSSACITALRRFILTFP